MAFSVAIDGPAGAGKGTISKFISGKFHLKHLDTGLLYREAARLVIQEGVDVLDVVRLEEVAHKVDTRRMIENNLRSESIAAVASQIAVVPSLRRVLTQKMRDFSNNLEPIYQGIVLDGRDVATVILPQADVKLYVTADEQVRALRRTKELDESSLQKVLEEIKLRDNRDKNRQAAPMQIVDDAIVLDTTFLSVEEVCQKAYKIVENTILNWQQASAKSCISSK